MYSQRYGTPPIVHATGGLVDSVVDCTPPSLAAGTATGFKFFAPNPEALMGAVRRCIEARADPAVWRAVQRNGMARDFGWSAAARQYAAVYERAVSV
jgi:starch synthase